MTLEDRLKRVKENNSLKIFNYVRMHRAHPNMVEFIYCKCGAPIQTLVGDPKYQWEEGGKTIMLAILAPTSSYDELTIEFKDGSAHVTPTCKKCKRDIRSKTKLEELYMADVAQWIKEGATNLKAMDREVRGRRA